jgi:hypothetical protein
MPNCLRIFKRGTEFHVIEIAAVFLGDVLPQSGVNTRSETKFIVETLRERRDGSPGAQSQKAGALLCTDCASIQRFHAIEEREADFPIYWKRW